jgi:hypothetical protein
MSERTLYERVEVIRGFKYIRLKSGRLLNFMQAYDLAETAHTDLARAVSRAFKLAGNELPKGDDWDPEDYDLERLEWFLDGVQRWLDSVRETIEKRRGVKTKEERIALLRRVEGRTPEEAAAFLKKADELERRMAS